MDKYERSDYAQLAVVIIAGGVLLALVLYGLRYLVQP